MNSIESVERLNKLVRRLNPEQFVTVDVDTLVHLLAAWKARRTARRTADRKPAVRIYVKLWVYDYDCSRSHWVQHDCKSVQHARLLLKRLRSLQGKQESVNRTDRWLMRNHGIYGFIAPVGITRIYEETISTRIHRGE